MPPIMMRSKIEERKWKEPLVKVLFLSLSFILTMASANADCGKLYEEAEKACFQSSHECKNLGACVSKRKTCPMDIGSPSACESFDHCMKDTDALISAKPKDLSKGKFKNRCIYIWNAGRCYLYNTGWEIRTFPSCPGRRVWGEGKGDRNFDCEGHRQLTNDYQKDCKRLNDVYERTCKGNKDFKPVPHELKCKYLSVKVFPADTEHKGSKAVDHGTRDRQKSVPHWDEGTGGDTDGSKATGK